MNVLRKWLAPVGSWGKWVIATGVGLYVGWGLNLVIRPLLVVNRIDLEWPLDDLRTVYLNLDLAGFILLAVFSGLITGAIVGLFQWLALLRKTGDMGLWIPATAVGFGIDYLLKAVFFLLDHSERSGGRFPPQQGSILPMLFVITPFLGAFLIGLSQWLVLRRKVRLSGLWMLTTAIAIIPKIVLIPEIHALSSSLKNWVMRLAPTMPIGVIPLTKLVYPLPYLFEGIIVGAATGIVMVLLIRQSTKRSHVPVANDLQPVNP
jgi:hypothetical protein